MVKVRIPLCAREIRKRLTYLQGEELACPAEDDEPVDEGSDELQEEEQPEWDLHAAEIVKV